MFYGDDETSGLSVSSSPPVETSSQDVRIATLVYQLAWLVIYFKDFFNYDHDDFVLDHPQHLHRQFPLIEHLVSIFGTCVHDLLLSSVLINILICLIQILPKCT